MKTKILFGISTLVATSLLAADSSPKDDVIGAAKKLAQKENYGWKTSNQFGGFASSAEGKANKQGEISLAVTFGDNTTEAFLKGGGKAAIKAPDQPWQSIAELEKEEGPIQFLVRRLQVFKAPAEQAQDLASKSKEIKKDGEAYSSELTEAGAKELLTFGRRRPNTPEPKNAKGSVKFWTKDGLLSKLELKLAGTVTFGDDEQDIEGTTTVEIKDIDKSSFEIPEAAKKKLE